MYCNYNYSCSSGCNNGCSCCANEYYQYYRSRFVDVPMCIYYGDGYTAEDSLISIQNSLSDISRSVSCNRCRCRNCRCG